MFSSPLSDLAVEGSTTERTKGDIYESIDSAENNSSTSHRTHAPLLRAFAESGSGKPATPGGLSQLYHCCGRQAPFRALTSGAANTAIGNFSLFSVTTGNNNTAVGAASLDLNIADNNTAIGTAALLFNIIGTNNTANGVAALENNVSGDFNTANGAFALLLTLPAKATRPSAICAHERDGRWQHRVGRKCRNQSYHWRQ